MRKVFITGGASGIGEACVEAFTNAGHHVAFVDINKESGEKVAARTGAQFFEADLIAPGEAAAVTHEAIGALDGLDVLVPNAGVQFMSPIDTFPEDTWRDLLELLLTAPFILTKTAWEALKASKTGRIVHIGSAHSLAASPYKSAYVAAKHGLAGLAKVTAQEGGEHGITCNVVAPAYVKTPLVRQQLAKQAETRGISEQEVEEKVFLAGAAVKRMLEPSDVADLVMYLARPESWAMTGTVYPIDTGWLAG